MRRRDLIKADSVVDDLSEEKITDLLMINAGNAVKVAFQDKKILGQGLLRKVPCQILGSDSSSFISPPFP